MNKLKYVWMFILIIISVIVINVFLYEENSVNTYLTSVSKSYLKWRGMTKQDNMSSSFTSYNRTATENSNKKAQLATKKDILVTSATTTAAYSNTREAGSVENWRVDGNLDLLGNYTYNAAYKRRKTLNLYVRWKLKTATNSLVTIRNAGRTGNCLFEYAALLGIAYMNNKKPAISPDNPLLKYFDLTFVEKIDVKKGKWVRVTEKGYGVYDRKMEKLPKENVTLSTYFQSWKYFNNIGNLIREELTFRSNIVKSAEEKFMRYVWNRTKPIIGIHVRRTDLVTNKVKFDKDQLSYLNKAMTYMTSRYGNVTFLVATDDVQWCRERLNKSDVIVVDKGDAGVDMSMMTNCDHMIITKGSFGFWIAWLADGHTVYYEKPKGQNTGFSQEDYYLPTWTALGP